MRLAYFDCASGLSGDMALAALIHAGADGEAIDRILHGFPVGDFELTIQPVEVRGTAAVRVGVSAGPQGVIRTYSSIRPLLDAADLPPAARRTAQRAYRRLAEAVAVAHGKDADLVTFHEFGSVDCLVDLVGCALALDQLGVERVYSSPVPTGFGMVRTEHGMMPIPSPVVMELLRGVPTYSRGIPVELVTATGAAVLASVAEGYGDMPTMRADRIGYGAGVETSRADLPNVVRVVIGDEQPAGVAAEGPPRSGDVLIQAFADTLSRGEQGRLLGQLERAGAADVWLTEAVGPGRRPRLVINVVGPAAGLDGIIMTLRDLGVAGPVRTSPIATA
jgi:pyridinium-3,5-bisthiocarboxylic acid mononucleotide nickel chelatase